MLISTLLYFSIIWIGNHQLEDQDKDHLDGRLTTIVITDSQSGILEELQCLYNTVEDYTYMSSRQGSSSDSIGVVIC